MNNFLWRSAGAVERDGLENRCGGYSTQGSNPCSSAIFLYFPLIVMYANYIKLSVQLTNVTLAGTW